MKQIATIFIILLGLNTYSQTIVDLFYKVSDYRNNYTDTNELRNAYKRFLNNEKNENRQEFAFTKIDGVNGFISGEKYNMEYQEITSCYWNMSNGNKLIAYATYQCATIFYSEWYFYEYSVTDGIKVCNRKVIPDSLCKAEDFFDFKKMQLDNNSTDYNELLQECKQGGYTTRMILPRHGKNITIVFTSTVDEDVNLSDKVRYVKGRERTLELIWNDGYFIKGDWID